MCLVQSLCPVVLWGGRFKFVDLRTELSHTWLRLYHEVKQSGVCIEYLIKQVKLSYTDLEDGQPQPEGQINLK